MIIGFVFTNYNNSSYTRAAVESLILSPDWNHCRVVIVDNDSRQSERDQLAILKSDYDNVHIIANSVNLGYFPGLNIGIDYLMSENYDLHSIVIGNNDLVFPENFTTNLLANTNLSNLYPVIAPDIITPDGTHQNPHVKEKIGRAREIIWDVYYSHYLLARVIQWLANITKAFTKRKDYLDFQTPQLIYQGYGACYLLGPLFLKHFRRLWAPTILMGEEFFLSKQLASQGYRVMYDPSIIVYHHDHACVSRLASRKLWEFARESHKIYRQYVQPFRKNMNVKDYSTGS